MSEPKEEPILVADPDGVMHDPFEIANWLDECGNRAHAENYHDAEKYRDAASVVRGLVGLLVKERDEIAVLRRSVKFGRP